MELMTKLKEMIPWRRKPLETHEVLSLRDDINRLFDRFLLSPFDWTRSPSAGYGTGLDETDQGVIVRVEVPGLDPTKLHVTVRGTVLQISYEQHDEWRNGDQQEGRRYAAFHRTISLPEGVETSKAEATCKHGLLTVRIPWTKEAKEEYRRVLVSVE